MGNEGIDFLNYTLSMPNQIYTAWSLPAPVVQKPKNIVVAGMGASSIGGDILQSLLLEILPIQIFVNRSYSIPAFVSSETLFFSVSHSGNTEETLTATKKALERGAKVIGIGTGGKLEELCASSGATFIKVPKSPQPRAAVASLFFPMLKTLHVSGLLDMENSVTETVNLLNSMKPELGYVSVDNGAKGVAALLRGKFPIIFAAGPYTAIARRLSNRLQEDCRTLSYFSEFPEMNHNEIMAWPVDPRAGETIAVLLRDPQENDRVGQRIELTKHLAFKTNTEIWALGESLLCKIFSLLYFTDLISVYLALDLGINPNSSETIESLKKELSALPRLEE